MHLVGSVPSWVTGLSVVLDGEESDSVPVTSGVPQGSVLGPILFLIYINDLPDLVTSNVRLFAYDTAVYLTTEGPDGGRVLQNNLDNVSVWESRWVMEFNPTKSQVVRVTTSRRPVNTLYYLHGQVLEAVTSVRYLGVNISTGLSWNAHIDRIIGNTNRTLGFLKRNIKTKLPRVRETVYNTLVCPYLECAAPVWDPHTQKNILQIEKTQRRAARWTTSDYDTTCRSSVTAMLDNRGWRTLEQRRTDARLSPVCGIVYGLMAIPMPEYIEAKTRFSRNCHSMIFRQVHTSRNFYTYSFFPLAIALLYACQPLTRSRKHAIGRLLHYWS